VSVPSGAIAGWVLKSAGLSALAVKLTLCVSSCAGPGAIPVAQPAIV
jgi:hypothetical protein